MFYINKLLKSKKGRGIVNNSGETESSISNNVKQQKNDEEVLNEDILDIEDEDEAEDNLTSDIKNDMEENSKQIKTTQKKKQ